MAVWPANNNNLLPSLKFGVSKTPWNWMYFILTAFNGEDIFMDLVGWSDPDSVQWRVHVQWRGHIYWLGRLKRGAQCKYARRCRSICSLMKCSSKRIQPLFGSFFATFHPFFFSFSKPLQHQARLLLSSSSLLPSPSGSELFPQLFSS